MDLDFCGGSEDPVGVVSDRHVDGTIRDFRSGFRLLGRPFSVLSRRRFGRRTLCPGHSTPTSLSPIQQGTFYVIGFWIGIKSFVL